MKVGIHSIEFYLPAQTIENETLAQLYPEWTSEKIYAKTGIRSRHIACDNECVSDMVENAAKNLFIKHNINPASIDFLILVTESPDYLLPPTSCIVQDRLQLPQTTGAIDVNLGCSGYIYGLKLAKALIASEEAQNVLLLTGDLYSKHINPLDKSTRTLFGDAASASLITTGENVSNILRFSVGSNGAGYNHLIIPSGGMRMRTANQAHLIEGKDEVTHHSINNIHMNGPEIMLFSIDMVPKNVTDVLLKNSLTLEEIDWFVFHQANQYILDYLKKKIRIPQDKFIIDMEDTGNTVSSSIPLALKRTHMRNKCFKPGDKILLVGFGVGLSWGATIIDFGGVL